MTLFVTKPTDNVLDIANIENTSSSTLQDAPDDSDSDQNSALKQLFIGGSAGW